MKRKLFIILALCLVLSFSLMACTEVGTLEKRDLQTGKGDDKVNTLLLTDIRFDGSEADSVRERMITKMIEDKAKTKDAIEFIAIAGNIVNCEENGKVMKKAAKFLDSFDIPWATSIGELDVKGKASKNEIVDILTSKTLKNSMFMRGESYEYNYCLKMVKENGGLVNIMYFVDTSVSCSDEFVEWYKNMTTNISFQNATIQGKMINSHIILNRALPMIKETAGTINIADKTISLWRNGSKLQDAIIALGSTKSILFGFDSLNDYKINNVKNAQWGYIRSMAFNSAMDEKDQKFKEQASMNGCSYYAFGPSDYVNVQNIRLSPIDFKEEN